MNSSEVKDEEQKKCRYKTQEGAGPDLSARVAPHRRADNISVTLISVDRFPFTP